METNIEILVAEKNWNGIAYNYSEATEETKLQYAYFFGKAHLFSQQLKSLPLNLLIEKLTEAFRISLYDRRLVEDMKEPAGSNLLKILELMEKKAWDYTRNAGDDNANGAENSRLGFEHYLLIYFLHPDEQLARRYLSKAKIFLIETHVAVLINDKCRYKCAWDSLDRLLVMLKVLDTKFVEAIIALLRLYNTVEFQRKSNQCAYLGHLLEIKEQFSAKEIELLTNFHGELQTEFIEILMEVLLGKEEYKKKLQDSKIKRAEAVKEFAVQYANCPDDLDHSFIKETLVHKRASDLMAQHKNKEALDIIREEYADGIPTKTFLIRALLNKIVDALYKRTRDMKYVLQALEIDKDNEQLKEYLMK